MRLSSLLLVLSWTALSAAAGWADPLEPAGSQFQVNDVTSQGQFEPRVAYEPGGAFVIVWSSGTSAEDDIGSYSVQARLFAPDGSASGLQFQVNTYTTGYQGVPDVASGGPLGDFFLVWRSTDDVVDTDGRSIKARRFTSSGVPLEGEFLVNSYTTGEQSGPRVAVDPTGQAVVVWSSEGSDGGDTESASIQAQLYTPNGSASGAQFQVNTYTPSLQNAPAVASAATGDFVIAWTSAGSPDTDLDESIQARLFFSNGMPNGDQFQVNTYTPSLQQQAAVAMQPSGEFLLAWSSSQSLDDADSSVQARVYEATGAPVGEPFLVNTYTPSFQRAPSVAAGPEGSFLVTWDSGASPEDDSDLSSVQAQLLDAAGAPLGAQMQINSVTTSFQFETDIAWDGAHGFVVTWTSYRSSGNDTSEGSVQAQRYTAEIPLFADGFESGDASAWSETLP